MSAIHRTSSSRPDQSISPKTIVAVAISAALGCLANEGLAASYGDQSSVTGEHIQFDKMTVDSYSPENITIGNEDTQTIAIGGDALSSSTYALQINESYSWGGTQRPHDVVFNAAEKVEILGGRGATVGGNDESSFSSLTILGKGTDFELTSRDDANFGGLSVSEFGAVNVGTQGAALNGFTVTGAGGVMVSGSLTAYVNDFTSDAATSQNYGSALNLMDAGRAEIHAVNDIVLTGASSASSTTAMDGVLELSGTGLHASLEAQNDIRISVVDDKLDEKHREFLYAVYLKHGDGLTHEEISEMHLEAGNRLDIDGNVFINGEGKAVLQGGTITIDGNMTGQYWYQYDGGYYIDSESKGAALSVRGAGEIVIGNDSTTDGGDPTQNVYITSKSHYGVVVGLFDGADWNSRGTLRADVNGVFSVTADNAFTVQERGSSASLNGGTFVFEGQTTGLEVLDHAKLQAAATNGFSISATAEEGEAGYAVYGHGGLGWMDDESVYNIDLTARNEEASGFIRLTGAKAAVSNQGSNMRFDGDRVVMSGAQSIAVNTEYGGLESRVDVVSNEVEFIGDDDGKPVVEVAGNGSLVVQTATLNARADSDKGTLFSSSGEADSNTSADANVSLSAERGTLTGDWIAQGEEGKFLGFLHTGEKGYGVIEAELGASQVVGNLTAKDFGTIDLTLDGGSLQGSTSMSEKGKIDIELTGESETRSAGAGVWNVTGDSNLNRLTLRDGTLNLAWRQDNSSVDYKTVKVAQFGSADGETAAGGNLYFNIDLEKEAEGSLDRLEAENVSGTYTGHVNFDNPKDLADKLYTESYLIHQEAGSMQVNNPDGKPMSGDGMMSKWSWKFRPANLQGTDLTEDDLHQLGNTGEGVGDWILVRDTSSGSGEGGDETPPESEQIKNLGSSVAQAIGWLSEKNDLRRRLGEVRYGAQAGAWAKVFTRQDRAEGFAYNGFKQNTTGVHVGYDAFASRSESSAWLVGATLRYAQSDQEGLETAYGGDGETNEYSGKLYATWMHEKGSYLDALVQIGYYDQEIRGRSNSGYGSFDADYHNIGFGTSIEIGHMFSLSNQSDDRRWFNHWFIEPQIELSYFYIKGRDFKTSTGLRVEQGDADFLTGRAGFVIGKKFNYGTPDDLDRRYFQIGLIGGVNHEFLGDQEIRFIGTDGVSTKVDGHGLGGTSFYYGLTADWQIANRLRIYAELDREEGEHYTKDYGINIGFKYSFD